MLKGLALLIAVNFVLTQPIPASKTRFRNSSGSPLSIICKPEISGQQLYHGQSIVYEIESPSLTSLNCEISIGARKFIGPLPTSKGYDVRPDGLHLESIEGRPQNRIIQWTQ